MTGMVTGASRRLSTGEYDLIQATMDVVDQRGREMDDRWGINRLPSLVPIEWAERFATQSRKFSEALISWNSDQVRRHGDAMLRAYVKLEELAMAAGHEPTPPEQWEFDTPEGLVILVKDIRQTNMVERAGRQCQVWSLDEIANVVRSHPVLAKAKDLFPGAVLETIRPVKKAREQMDDSLEGLPF